MALQDILLLQRSLRDADTRMQRATELSLRRCASLIEGQFQQALDSQHEVNVQVTSIGEHVSDTVIAVRGEGVLEKELGASDKLAEPFLLPMLTQAHDEVLRVFKDVFGRAV